MRLLPKNVNIAGLLIGLATSAVSESKHDVIPSDDFIPAMRVIPNSGGSHGGNHCHRDKLQDQSELIDSALVRGVTSNLLTILI